jgi:hypothetical protein
MHIQKVSPTRGRQSGQPSTRSHPASVASGPHRPDDESSFVQTREEQIESYLKLSRDYQALLDEQAEIYAQRKEAERQIASCRLRKDRLTELIQKVQDERRDRLAAASSPPA